MAKITSIVYQPVEKKYENGRFDHFLRTPAQKVTLIANHGIEGDAKAGRNPRRQLNLLSRAWLDNMAAQGYKIAPGQFGEQLIVDGLDVLALASGTQLRLGETAVIEITIPRTGCIRLEAAQNGQLGLDGKDIGILAKVILGGIIQIDDSVREI